MGRTAKSPEYLGIAGSNQTNATTPPGISQQIAVLPELTDNIKTWRIKSVKYPQQPKYLSKTDIRYLDEIVSPVTRLVSINDFHAKTRLMETKFLDTLAQHLLTNHNIHVYHKSAEKAAEHVIAQALPREVEEILKLINSL